MTKELLHALFDEVNDLDIYEFTATIGTMVYGWCAEHGVPMHMVYGALISVQNELRDAFDIEN